MNRPHTPASTRFIQFDGWLDRRISELSPIARMLAEASILTACVALVIITAVLLGGAP